MTEIERLQAMLTECGIDWWSDDDGMTHWGGSVAFSDGDGISVATRLHGVTAEQAVEETLGRGECVPTDFGGDDYSCAVEVGGNHEFWEPACKCSACGELIPLRNYCPDCGARIRKVMLNECD